MLDHSTKNGVEEVQQEKAKERLWPNLTKSCSCIPGSGIPLTGQFWKIMSTLLRY